MARIIDERTPGEALPGALQPTPTTEAEPVSYYNRVAGATFMAGILLASEGAIARDMPNLAAGYTVIAATIAVTGLRALLLRS